MRLLLVGTCLLLAAAAPAAADEAAVVAVLEGQQEAWNSGDLDAFLEGYQQDEQTTFLGSGGLQVGFEAVAARFRQNYGDRKQMGELSFSELKVRPLGEDHAIVVGNFRLERPPDGGGEAQGRFSLVMRKTDAGWKIIHDHTS